MYFTTALGKLLAGECKGIRCKQWTDKTLYVYEEHGSLLFSEGMIKLATFAANQYLSDDWELVKVKRTLKTRIAFMKDKLEGGTGIIRIAPYIDDLPFGKQCNVTLEWEE